MQIEDHQDDQHDEQHARQPDTSSTVSFTGAAAATVESQNTDEEAISLEGANATLFDADQAYKAYHIGGYAGSLSAVPSHQSTPPPEDVFTMLDLWHHTWPPPILRWVSHCSLSILPFLHKIRRGEGLRQCDISSRVLSLIILSVSWLHAFLSSPLPISFLELFTVAQNSVESFRCSDSTVGRRRSCV